MTIAKEIVSTIGKELVMTINVLHKTRVDKPNQRTMGVTSNLRILAHEMITRTTTVRGHKIITFTIIVENLVIRTTISINHFIY